MLPSPTISSRMEFVPQPSMADLRLRAACRGTGGDASAPNPDGKLTKKPGSPSAARRGRGLQRRHRRSGDARRARRGTATLSADEHPPEPDDANLPTKGNATERPVAPAATRFRRHPSAEGAGPLWPGHASRFTTGPPIKP